MLPTRGRLSRAQAVQVPVRKRRLRDVVNFVYVVGSSCTEYLPELPGPKLLANRSKRMEFLASRVVRPGPESQACKSQGLASNWTAPARQRCDSLKSTVTTASPDPHGGPMTGPLHVGQLGHTSSCLHVCQRERKNESSRIITDCTGIITIQAVSDSKL